MASNILEQIISYDRQAEMDIDLNQVQQGTHAIIGCGGIGYWSAVLLAMMGTQHLVLIDGDRIESTNLNRVPAFARYLGKFKVNALKAQLRLLRPGIRVTCIPAHITEDTLLLLGNVSSQVHVVWDCTDDARIQQKIYSWCRSNNRKYVKLGYEGWKVGMYRHMNMWLPDDYRPGYTSSKANALSSIIAAALGMMYLGRQNYDDVEIDLKQLVSKKEA